MMTQLFCYEENRKDENLEMEMIATIVEILL